MSKHNIVISEILNADGNITVKGTVGEEAFEAATLRWGSKMLMHVTARGLDRGTRVAIGHRAKAAVKAAGLALPEAVLKRPRKAKPEGVQAEATVTPVLLTAEEAQTAAVQMLAQLDLVMAEDGFFSLESAP